MIRAWVTWLKFILPGSLNRSHDFLIPFTSIRPSILQMTFNIAFYGNTGSFRNSNVYPRTQSFQAPFIEVTTCQRDLSMRARLSCLFAYDFRHARYIAMLPKGLLRPPVQPETRYPCKNKHLLTRLPNKVKHRDMHITSQCKCNVKRDPTLVHRRPIKAIWC